MWFIRYLTGTNYGDTSSYAGIQETPRLPRRDYEAERIAKIIGTSLAIGILLGFALAAHFLGPTPCPT